MAKLKATLVTVLFVTFMSALFFAFDYAARGSVVAALFVIALALIVLLATVAAAWYALYLFFRDF